MNQQLYQLLHEIMNTSAQTTNILKYIDAIKDRQNLSPQMVKKYFIQSKFWLQTRSGWVQRGQILNIFIANLETNQKSMRLLECFFKAFPKIQSMDLWNCSVDQRTFEELRKVSGRLESIGLRDSGIGKNIGSYLQVLNLTNIRSLLIMSEPIGNKSIKFMMKIQWPALEQLRWVNTDLTTDFIRTLTKLSHGLSDIRLLGQNKAISAVLVKQIIKLCPKETTSIISLTPFCSSNDSYYVCWLVKSASIQTSMIPDISQQIYGRYPVSIKVQFPSRVKTVAYPFVEIGWQEQQN